MKSLNQGIGVKGKKPQLYHLEVEEQEESEEECQEDEQVRMKES